MPTWLIILISIFGGIIVLLFVALLCLYLYVFYSPKKGQLNDVNVMESTEFFGQEEKTKPLIAILMKIPYEDVFITSFDKLRLHAKVYENKNSKKVAIMFHGYRGAPYRDFSGGATEIIKLGYNVILIDERAHCLSQGHSITFGVRETKDAVSWVNYARERFGEDIELIMIGISMGGATVLMASDKIGRAKIIADAPYTKPKVILQEVIKSLKLPLFFVYPLLYLSLLIFGRTNLHKLSAYDSIKNTTNDILIIHGDSDSIVPHAISYALYQTYPNKIQYELFSGADHGTSYLVDTDRYRKIILTFLGELD